MHANSASSPSRSRLAVCTISEGAHHEGTAALINSLHHNGFRGEFWLAFRGPRPAWIGQGVARGEDVSSFDGVDVHLLPLDGDMHLAHRKPTVLREVLERSPGAAGVVYFDPDITCLASWAFFERWSERGVMLCEDCTFPRLPSDHPHRSAWREAIEAIGIERCRPSDSYYNSGFIGLPRSAADVAVVWECLIAASPQFGADLSTLKSGTRERPFQVPDQDTLNVAIMASDARLSTIGPDGMGFIDGGYVMHHAVDSPKPWRSRYLLRQLRDGVKPSAAHKDFWRHTNSPIRLYGGMRRRLVRLDMAAALLVSRFYSR